MEWFEDESQPKKKPVAPFGTTGFQHLANFNYL